MLILKFFIDFIKLMNEKASPGALAGGAALGAIIGLTPLGSLHNGGVCLLIFLLPVNKSASVLSAAGLALLAPLGDPLFNRLGHFLLVDAPTLRPLWVMLNNTPVFPWSRFNNTLVLGSLTSSLILFFPLFFLGKIGVVRYRERVLAKIQQWKLTRLVKASKLFSLYQKFS